MSDSFYFQDGIKQDATIVSSIRKISVFLVDQNAPAISFLLAWVFIAIDLSYGTSMLGNWGWAITILLMMIGGFSMLSLLVVKGDDYWARKQYISYIRISGPSLIGNAIFSVVFLLLTYTFLVPLAQYRSLAVMFFYCSLLFMFNAHILRRE